MPQTIRIHRVLKAPPEKVYRAFLDADAQCRWAAPFGFIAKMHHFEPKVGGTFKMSFINFTTQQSHTFGGRYLELIPNQKLRYTDAFDDPNLPGEMSVTVELKEVFCGTDLTIVQEGVPDIVPEAACYLGWNESMIQLAQLVDPDIKG